MSKSSGALASDHLDHLVLTARACARAASEVALPLFRSPLLAETKPGAAFDPVTEADRGAEAAIRKVLGDVLPDHGVVGEEYGQDRPDAEFVWVLDPIDGTRAFISGLPLWTTLIALCHQGRPVLGLIAQPYLGEVFVGTETGSVLHRDNGADQVLRVRPCETLGAATLATTDPGLFNGAELGAWRQVAHAARLARLGCDAYAYAMCASGHIDLVAESGLKVWDWMALQPVVEGAGGSFTDWRGEPLRLDPARDFAGGARQVIACGQRAVLDEALVAFARSAEA
ncbi:MAG: histidinol-phosphatase [Brevundimonas sp.]|uniref:histidinol-phosphatase n=1 Tax=Brevundimonas sp. TaxID=1871086 RepID=UPI00391A2C5C